MKSFVVMTYYQLMHSIAMALTLEEKPLLYFSKHYLNAKDEFIDRIRDCGVFADVVGITGRGDFVEFVGELQITRDYTEEEIDEVGNSIFEKHLEPMYAELFKDADLEDTIYVYNDFQYHFYYIEKHFKDIVGIEDGYASLKQQLKVHRFVGDQELLLPFLGKYYPQPLYQSPKIKKIISSCWFDDIPDEYKEKVEVLNYNDLIHQNYEAFSKALMDIFDDVRDLEIEDGGVLFLGQPLARSRYCTRAEEYMLIKKAMLKEVAAGRQVYFKAHPANTVHIGVYEWEGIHLLPAAFPVEVLNYKGCTFEKVLSFGSTGVDTLTCVKGAEKIFENQGASVKEIRRFIKENTKDDRVVIDLYYLVRELTPDAFINVYSGAIPREKFLIRSHVVVPEELKEEAEAFFASDPEPFMKKYRKKHQYLEECPWEDMLAEMRACNVFGTTPEVIGWDGIMDEERTFSLCARHHEDYDFLMVVEEKNPMYSPMLNMTASIRDLFCMEIAMQRHTEIVGRRMKRPWLPLSPGFINTALNAELINRMWHHTLAHRMLDGDEVLPELERTLVINTIHSVARKFSDNLYISPERYEAIEDGLAHFQGLAHRWVEWQKEDEEERSVNYVILQIAMIIYRYIDWRRITDHNSFYYEPILDFFEDLEIPEQMKLEILAMLTSTVMFEKSRWFAFGFGPDTDYKNYKVRVRKAELAEVKARRKEAERLRKEREKNNPMRRIKRKGRRVMKQLVGSQEDPKS